MKSLIRPASLGASPLVRDYLTSVPAALDFYGGSPFSIDSFHAKLKDVQRRFGSDERSAAAAALRPTSDRARERLDRFVKDGGAVVTTGQQAGFLTGPLYTIHKAASAIALAKHLETRLDVPVLPVFWVASEDHDWAEVNHTVLIDRRGELQRYELEGRDQRPLPMSERQLEGDLDILCDHITQSVGATRHNEEYVRQIIDPYRREGATVAGAFSEAFQALFAGSDLLVTDAADPAVKQASLGVLKEALTDASEHEARLSARSKEMAGRGYGSQVAVLERGVNVFFSSEGGRHRLYRKGEDFVVRERKGTILREELLQTLLAEPERFSPNVFLRPVVESAVFPTLAYVGGPGEIAYFAQVTALFDAYGIAPPVAVPRYSALVVERAVERVLEGLELTIEDVREPREALVERLARREVPGPVGDGIGRIRDDLAAGFERLIDEAVRLDPTLGGSLGSIRNRELAWMARAERTIVGAIKRGDRLSLDRLDRVLDALRPGGSAQERVLNVLPYLGRYGPHFLRELERSIGESWRLPE
ncbi:MAG: bacillithiol biosynthesis cysteine-adding enzyme BshC [Gemmatimonadota bacterium]